MDYARATNVLRQKTSLVPKLALICGTGLSSLQQMLRDECRVPYSEVPGLPSAQGAWHAGEFVFGTISGVPVVLLGRLHGYDGFTPEETIRPIRLARKLGAEYLLATCNCGGIRADLQPGDVMLIEDHVSFFVPSPLRGANDDSIGPRFPDGNCYDRDFSALLRQAAAAEKIELKSGVYLQTSGPQFESAAEIRFCRAAGADVIGMSGATDAIGAHHCGLKVASLAVVANLAEGLSPEKLSVAEICSIAESRGALLTRLILRLLTFLSGRERSRTSAPK